MLSLRTDVKRIDPEDQRTALWRFWMCCDAFLMIHSGNPWESKQSLRTVFRIQKDSPCYQEAKFGLWTSWEYFDIFFVYNRHSWICLTFVTCRRKFMKDRAVETKCASASGTRPDCSLIDHCLVSIGMPPRPLCPKSFCSDMSRLLVLV